VWAVVAIAIAMTCLLYARTPAVDFDLLWGSALLTFIGFIAARLAYRVQRSSLGETSFIPYLSALMLYPSWTVVVLVGVGSAAAEISRRKVGIKLVFNVAQFVLAAAVASFVYVLLGGQPLSVNKEFAVIPHSSAVIAFLLVNTFSVAAAIGLAEGKSILKTWYEGNAAGFVFDIVLIPFVYGFARAFADWGMVGAAALLALVVGLRFTYQTKHQLETTNKELLELFVHTVEFRDPYTSGHSQRVSRYSRIIAKAVGLSPKEIARIEIAGMLHDVGKIHEIFAPILSKPGRLTPEERAIMELHPIKSAELVAKLSEFVDIVPAVRHHHENWDGTGYPDRLAGREIPLGSRIIMFADTIDAMTTDRPYRKAMTEIEVREELQKFKGKQFDPFICDALLDSPHYHQIFVPSGGSKNSLSLTQIFDRARRPKAKAVA
jgi:HD-GYP domain-containing protein (c-di-GMP phosphodiesterase class II)